MGIVDEDIARVREATDIVALISQYTQLKRVGTRWTGLCPFHAEKSPSFSVNGTEGFYHCFGCSVSGDAITFVREKEQLDFVGAIEMLASRSGITLRYTDRDQGEGRKRQTRLFELTERAAQWYHDQLRTSPGAAAARSYLRGRGFDADEVARYRIGWAPDSWDDLVRTLQVSRADVEAAGLGFQNRAGRMQDFFRARILFPIIDERDRVVGFGGRKLPDADGAKYQNSRDNVLYNKSKVLYGLNWAKADAVNSGEIVICEGYTDVIGFGRAGIARAVATCGTSLTEDHVKHLKRFTNRLVLAYDADEAGQAAAERVYAWEKAYDVEVAVVSLPEGSDPDELARTSPEVLHAAVAEARPFLSFRLQRVLAAGDMTSVEGRARTADAALAVVAEHPDALVRDPYLMEIADRCRLDVALLRERAAQRPTSGSSRSGTDRGGSSRGDGRGRSAARNAERGRAQPARPTQQGYSEPMPDEPADYGYEGYSYEDEGYSYEPRQVEPRDRRPIAPPRDGVETEALRLAIHQPEVAAPYLVDDLFADPLIRSAHRAVVDAGSVTVAIEAADQPVADLLTRLVVETSEAEWYDVLSRLATEVGRSVLIDLEAEARTAEDPLAYSASIAWLKRTLDTMRGSKAEVENLEQLLAWLADRRRFTGQE